MEEIQHCAYLDESGNTNLDATLVNVGDYYVVTAVTVPMSQKTNAEAHFEAVRSFYFQTGEIKSSKIDKTNFRRREIILNQLVETPIPYGVLSLVVQKSELRSLGYTFGESFIKNL